MHVPKGNCNNAGPKGRQVGIMGRRLRPCLASLGLLCTRACDEVVPSWRAPKSERLLRIRVEPSFPTFLSGIPPVMTGCILLLACCPCSSTTQPRFHSPQLCALHALSIDRCCPVFCGCKWTPPFSLVSHSRSASPSVHGFLVYLGWQRRLGRYLGQVRT